MKNLKLKWKLLVSYGVIFLFLLILGLASLFIINRMSSRNIDYAEHLVPAVEEIGLVKTKLLSVRRYLLNAVITNDLEDYQRVQQSMNQDRDALYAALDNLESINSDYSATIDQIRVKLQSVSEYNQQIMDLSLNIGNTEAEDQAYEIYIDRYAPAFTEAETMIDTLNEEIDQDVLQQDAQAKAMRTLASVVVVLILAAGLIAVFIFTMLMLRYILIPTQKLLSASKALGRGDFQNASFEYDSEDEFGTLASEITRVMQRIVFITEDLRMGLQAVADGRFDAKSQADDQYEGEYQGLRDSVYSLIHILNGIMCQLHTVSSEVSSGAEQVASAAQALSQGSTQQASSIQDLASTLAKIADQVDENTKLIDDTGKKVEKTVEEVSYSTDRMQQMLVAMQNINAASSEIGKIIHNIEDIAFQTNILALNAAVEAARAGNAGKGFAVVADEVRRLAANTAEASKNTGELISKALRAVEDGKSIADETATSLERVNGIIGQLASQAEQVARNSQSQDEAIKQLSNGVDQISAVVQNNSATAEESAAASEELSSQALVLKNLVSKFTISCDTTEPAADESLFAPPQACGCGTMKY